MEDGSRSETKLNQPSRFLPGKKLVDKYSLVWNRQQNENTFWKRMRKLADIKTENTTNCHMAGGARLGLTSQTSVATFCGSDRISVGNPARPYTSER